MTKKQNQIIEAIKKNSDSTFNISVLAIVLNNMSWGLAVPDVKNEDDLVKGMIIGIPEYIDKITSYLPEDINF